MKLKSILVILLLAAFIIGCSGSVDTNNLSAEEYYNYVLNLYNEEDYDIAVQEWQNFLLQYSGSAFNDDGQYYLGMTYFKKRQFLLAAYEFSKLIRNIPASPYVPDAQFMLAESYYELSPPYPLDQTYTKKAIEEFQAFIDFFPANPKVEETEQKIKSLTEKLAQKDYHSGVIYEKMEYEKAAMKYYAVVAETYHDTQYAPLALYNKIQLELKKGLTNEALADVSIFLSRYPNDPNAKELQELEAKLTIKK